MKVEIINADKIKTILNSVIAELNYDINKTSATDIEHFIHTLRVTLKRIQALWHLMAPFITKIVYQREKNNLNTACKLLGVTRDEAIRIVTLKNLYKHVDKKKEKLLLAKILKIMQKRPIIYSQTSIRKATTTIKRSLLLLKKIKPTNSNINRFKQRLIKSFYQSKNRVVKINNFYSDKDLHRLRISSKKFYYELSYLTDIWPKRFNKKICQLDTLQQKLGAIHDLIVTSTYVLSHQEYFDNPKRVIIFIGCINKRKKHLIKQSMKLAKKVFLHKHTVFYL